MNQSDESARRGKPVEAAGAEDGASDSGTLQSGDDDLDRIGEDSFPASDPPPPPSAVSPDGEQ